ncbi:MAG: hypothetical protein HQK89_17935 [Nitrospirae bacterium]|nr:hypothetical protein [Nitrospirota bacterium]
MHRDDLVPRAQEAASGTCALSATGAKDEKIVFYTSRSQLDKIEDFRYANRISSRAEAVRKLIDLAIESIIQKKKSLPMPQSDLPLAAETQENYGPEKKR